MSVGVNQAGDQDAVFEQGRPSTPAKVKRPSTTKTSRVSPPGKTVPWILYVGKIFASCREHQPLTLQRSSGVRSAASAPDGRAAIV